VKILNCAAWMLAAFAAPVFAQIPSNAISSGQLTGASGWTWTHDTGTPGTSVGSSTYPVSSPSLTGHAREFYVSYWDHGGERYHLSFGHNTTITHMVYDTYVYVEDVSQLANLEMDLYQVLGNGMTVFLATQCSGYSGTWEYTYVSSGKSHWHTSNVPCNLKYWKPKTWHHIQIAVHRDNSGNVTHDWVNVDGNTQYFKNTTSFAGKYLRWATGDLVLNLQLDGASSNNGQIKVFLDKLQVYRW
jgi:hypothetical protein